MTSEKEIKLKSKVELLQYLLDRECNCDKSKCAEHFHYMKSLLYEYKTQLNETD
jgi:hypothetical protein